MKQQAEAFISSYMKEHILPPSHKMIMKELGVSRSSYYRSYRYEEKETEAEEYQPKKEKSNYMDLLLALDRMDRNLNRLATLIS